MRTPPLTSMLIILASLLLVKPEPITLAALAYACGKGICLYAANKTVHYLTQYFETRVVYPTMDRAARPLMCKASEYMSKWFSRTNEPEMNLDRLNDAFRQGNAPLFFGELKKLTNRNEELAYKLMSHVMLRSLQTNLNLAMTLMKITPNPEALTDDNKTVIHEATIYGHQRFVKKLLNDKIFPVINYRDGMNRTALHYSCIYNRAKIARLLLEYGEQHEAIDVEGKTAMNYCIERGNYVTAEAFREANFDYASSDDVYAAKKMYLKEQISEKWQTCKDTAETCLTGMKQKATETCCQIHEFTWKCCERVSNATKTSCRYMSDQVNRGCSFVRNASVTTVSQTIGFISNGTRLVKGRTASAVKSTWTWLKRLFHFLIPRRFLRQE